MKLVVRTLPLIMLLASSLLTYGADKKTPAAVNVVDAGTFGIFIGGRRVATETFQIAQQGDGNVTRAELKVEDGTNKAVQKTELQLTGSGELRHYAWNEISPGKAQATVDPDAQFLMERISPSPQEKSIDQPFILPASTAILDDYFFSQRELLTWRYLGSNCSKNASGQIECKLTKAQFGALIPRQRASVLVTMEFVGREKVMIRGQQVELNRFNLQGEGLDWALWLDESHKLQRVLIASDATEVVRD
jgi:hypothetical protein